jgi:hypothetical protein
MAKIRMSTIIRPGHTQGETCWPRRIAAPARRMNDPSEASRRPGVADTARRLSTAKRVRILIGGID